MMQTVWNRVAQVRACACRCPQCRHSAQAVSRRAGTSTTPLRPKYWTSSTLWYSGIFAAAATFDAGVKIRRREQWDQAIADVKQDLGRTREVHTQAAQDLDKDAVTLSGKDEGDLLDAGYASKGDVVGAPGSLVEEQSSRDSAIGAEASAEGHEGECISIFQPLEPYTDLEEELSANLDSSRQRQHRARWNANTGPNLNVKALPPQSIYATDTFKQTHENRQWSPKKLQLIELAMDRLQIDFFLKLQEKRWVEDAACAVPDSYAAFFHLSPKLLNHFHHSKCQDLKRCRHADHLESAEFVFERSAGDLPICRYRQDDLGVYREEQYHLRHYIEEVFKLHESGEVEEPVCLAKIFYSLSVSPAPPTVDIFNTLINGLRRQRNTDLAGRAISVLEKSHVRPNEVTMASILEYYTETNNVESFRHYVQRMRGKHGGLMLANARVINGLPRGPEAANGRILPREGTPGKWVQLPYPTPVVFSALLQGVLHFGGFDPALRLCQNMREEGWGIDHIGFGILLRDCGKREDWQAGAALWREIVALKHKSKWLEDGKWQSAKLPLSIFVDMLRLCTRCKQRRAFEDVLDQAAKTYPGSLVRMLQMVKAQGSDGLGRGIPSVSSEEFAAHSSASDARGSFRAASTV